MCEVNKNATLSLSIASQGRGPSTPNYVIFTRSFHLHQRVVPNTRYSDLPVVQAVRQELTRGVFSWLSSRFRDAYPKNPTLNSLSNRPHMFKASRSIPKYLHPL